MSDESFRLTCKIEKADASLGLVFGWGIICTENGEPYFDLQDDWIPPSAMLKAACDFQLHSRATDDMHDENPDGIVVFSFPMTNDIKKVYRIQCDREGWMIAARPSEDVFDKFLSGEYTGFSIGGSRVKDTPFEEFAA